MVRNKLKISILAIFLGVFFSCSLKASEGEKQFSALQKTLSSIGSRTPGNSIVGVSVVDVLSGEEIYANNGDQLLNPASNAKLITAAGALKILGPDFRFKTDLYGRVSEGSIQGPLYLKGYADPTLMTSHLYMLVNELKAQGVTRIGGGIVIDDSYFDDENTPFAFDQQPNEDNRFRAPVGAVSLNHNAIGIQIRPGATVMSRARVTFDPPEYAITANETVTTASGAYTPRISATAFEDRTRVRVWGQIPMGSSSVRYTRRIDNPSLFTGYGLKGVLEDLGIAVGGGVSTGTVPSGTPLLARRVSEPLSSVLWDVGKMSNNFVSEMILKTIGAQTSTGPATWDASIKAVENQLEKWGIKAGTYEYKNGSGLFDANKISARQLSKLLREVYMDSLIKAEYLTHLATGGVDGTIASRFSGKESKGYVRAKTGTLNAVSALSGYVLDKDGRNAIAFTIMLNQAAGYVSSARKYQEDLVTAIASFLNK